MDLAEFQRAWWAFVAAWRSADDPDGLIAQALADGLSPADAAVEPPTTQDDTACATALVRHAGALDEAAYRTAHATTPRIVKDPVATFCADGWTQLFNPRHDFDLWWYWVEHLDPTRTIVNPLVHHLLAGARAGLSTVPPPGDDRPPTRFADGHPVRRACLVAGYDPDGIVDDYVVALVTELARHGDVFYLADCDLAPGEVDKLAGITAGAWAERHGRYDFGSWSMLARDLVGWDLLQQYDEVLFVNDSSYLLRPLDDLFAQMDATAADWWGLHATKRTYSRDAGDTEPLPLDEAWRRWSRANELHPVDHLHLSSYFVAYRRPVLADPGFRRRLDTVTDQRTKQDVIHRYELGLSHYLTTHGFRFGSALDGLWPYLPAYSADYWTALGEGFPVLKRNLLSQNPRRTPDLALWRERICSVLPDADVDTFDRNLLRTTADDARHRAMAVTTRPDGTVDYHETLTFGRFRAEDRATPTFDHWWAFPVDPETHRLEGSSRAVFEQVRHDPSIRKVVLTRSRTVDLPGENVVTVPLMTPEGQHLLMRCRTILVSHGPSADVHWPVSPLLHDVVVLRPSVALERFDGDPREYGACRAMVTAGPVDSLAVATVTQPLPFADLWPTGLPRHDFLTCPDEQLPNDLRAQRDLLHSALAGLPLALVAVRERRLATALTPDLADDLGRDGLAVGLRTLDAHQRVPGHLIDVSVQRVPDLEPALRAADLVISDDPSVLADAIVAGRSIVRLESGSSTPTFLDLDLVLTGEVCRDPADLPGLVARAIGAPAPDAAVGLDRHDPHAARRAVERIRALRTQTALA